MCARLVKKIWCDYIIDCSCYSEENKNRHNFLCATAWIAIAAKSDVWIAITFSLLMQMPRFTYHFNSFNLLFKAVPNLVQNIAFEKNLPVPTFEMFAMLFLVFWCRDYAFCKYVITHVMVTLASCKSRVYGQSLSREAPFIPPTSIRDRASLRRALSGFLIAPRTLRKYVYRRSYTYRVNFA